MTSSQNMMRLKVLHLITSLNIGGTERYLLSLCEDQKRDHDVSVAFLKDRGPVANELAAIGIQVRRASSPLECYRLIRSVRPDILHTHLYRANLVGRLAGAVAHVPVIISSQHGIDDWKTGLYSLLDRWTGTFADCIAADSEAAREVLIKRERIPGRKVRMIHSSAVNIRALRASAPPHVIRERLHIPPDVPLFGCVARLHESKGVQFIPAIARIILGTVPDAVFIIAGDGPLRGSLEDQLAASCLTANVRLLGWRDDIADLLSVMDVFFLPSVEESFPRSILEALALSIPVVAANVGGISEMITDRKHGLLVPPRDPAAIANALIWMRSHREESRKMAERGRIRVTAEFTLDRMLAETRALYDELTARRI